jgi:hypothetical protein
MNRSLVPLSGSAMVLAMSAAIYAQTPPVEPAKGTPAPAPAPSAGLVNDWLRGQSESLSVLDVGGQFRVRFEDREHFAIPQFPAPATPAPVDFQRGSRSNPLVLFREKLHLGYTPCAWFSAYVEGRDSFSVKDRRKPSPDTDHVDLHQAYVVYGNPEVFPISLKVGRQELIYGDERLVGAADWTNTGRVFDTVKVRFENSSLWVDGFVGRVVIPYDHHLNLPNDYDYFSGLYASTKALVPNQETPLYFLARNTGLASPDVIAPSATLPPGLRGATARDIYTAGLRIKSTPGALKGWDYAAEVAGQFGRFKAPAGAPNAGTNLDHEALAVSAGLGYTFSNVYGKPRFGFEYNFASGDHSAADNKHGTFENLFPTNHKFYGAMDFVSWQNLHNPHFSAALKPGADLKISLDYNLFWLADTADAFYQVNGAPRAGGAPGKGYGLNPAYDSFVGSELDLVLSYSVHANAAFQIGYGHFFVGSYVTSSLSSLGASDADWVYAQMVIKF